MTRRRWWLPVLAAPVVCAGVFFGVRWWRFYGTHVETDDAYVRADVAQVTPRIAGTVAVLLVDENWQVRAGDVLARLDPAEDELALRGAEAQLARAAQQVEAERAAVRAADSEVQLAAAELAQAQLDDRRAVQLAGRGVVPPERRDRARTTLEAAAARLAAARRAAERARADLGIPLEAPAAQAPLLRQAQAARDAAALRLSYTTLTAPVAGVVAKRTVEIGQHVQAGEPLMLIVPLAQVYVEANFKETQLDDVRIGQPATVTADIYPHQVYHGRVDSLSPGSGAAFALLPPENATGNWVKVVQRLPVRITLEAVPPDFPLRVGLSVLATIDTRDQHGPLLSPLRQTAAR